MTLNPDGTVNLDAIDPVQAIVDCGLCDDDGYRGLVLCDHVDHVSESAHGRALAKAELEKIQQRKAQRARGQRPCDGHSDPLASTETDERPQIDHPDAEGA